MVVPVVLAAAVLAASGCAGDEAEADEEGGTEPQGDAGVPGNVFEKLGVEKPDLSNEFQFNSIPEPYPEGDVDACKAFGADNPITKDVRDCSCEKCADLQRQCDALEGCLEVSTCAIEIGCNDAYTCYLIPSDAKCVPIIDKWGNTGLHTATSNRLGECTAAQQCRTIK